MKKILAAFVLVLPVTSAAAIQNIKFGGVAIHPIAAVQEIYDSNIYLTRNSVKSSLINKLSLGFGFMNREEARISLKGGYALDLLTYSKAPGTNNAVHHKAALELGYKLAGDRSITVADNYKATTDHATTESTARPKWTQNIAKLVFEAPLKGRLGYSFDVQHTVYDYLAARFNVLDRSEILAGGGIHYKLQPKTRLLAAYHYGALRYADPNRITATRTNDAIYNNFDVGITGEITAKLTGTVTGGFQHRTYQKSLGSAADKKTTGGYSLQLDWFPVAKTQVLMYGNRANIESLYLDSRYYISTLNYVSVFRELNKFKAGLGFSYETLNYPEKTYTTNARRSDTIANIFSSLDYNVRKWLTAGVGYAYKTRRSNEGSNNYVDNMVSMQIKGMF